MSNKNTKLEINNSWNLKDEIDSIFLDTLKKRKIEMKFESIENQLSVLSKKEYKDIYESLPEFFRFYKLKELNIEGKEESFYFISKESKENIKIKIAILLDRGNEVLIDFELLTSELFYLLSHSIELITLDKKMLEFENNILSFKNLIELEIESIIENFDYTKEYEDFYSYNVEKYLKSISKIKEK